MEHPTKSGLTQKFSDEHFQQAPIRPMPSRMYHRRVPRSTDVRRVSKRSMGVLLTMRAFCHSQRTIPCRRDAKGGFKQPTEMRLIHKPSFQGDLDQRSVLGEKFSGKVETPHEQIVVRTGPTH